MGRRKLTRKQRMMRAYAARVIAVLVIIVMVVLMFCGCLYIRDLFTKDKDDKKDTKVESDTGKDSQAVSGDNTQADIQDTGEDTLKYKGFGVVLDAGHGGYDGGTSSGDIIEKNINLPITLEVARLLEEQGIEVTLTRSKDDFVSLDDRIKISNQTTAELFVSLHCNFFEGDDSVDGLEVFYVGSSEGGQQLAESIANTVKQNPNIIVRGATDNTYYVTRHVNAASVLIEMGFLSNPTECTKLASDSYQKELAQAIANGIFCELDVRMGNGNENVTDDTVEE